jgi:chemotaxis protein histidine kinase CheA/CheY-like chemotaxis protein
MSDSDLDFDPDELAMLRQLFRSEAHDALEAVTARVLASGSTKPTAESLTEMMRVTHTLKGAAGTVGLNVMVDLAHRLESAFAALGRETTVWSPTTADLIVEVTDGLRGYLDQLASDAGAAEPLAQRLREQIERIAPARDSSPDVLDLPDPPSEPPVLTGRTNTRHRVAITPATGVRRDPASEPPLRRERVPGLAVSRTDTVSEPPPLRNMTRARATYSDIPSPNDSLSMPTITELGSPEGMPEPVLDLPSTDLGVPEPKSYLRVEPERIDALMSSAGELLFDRTRIERRVQLLRTLARDLARTRQSLRDAIASGKESRSLGDAENELASQATLLSQTTAALLDEIEALRRTIGELQRGLVRIRMESARNLMTHAARTLRALRRATGVHVELRTLGEETEFDKAVAEQLIDPITQLLRNAVAHAIEPPEERAARGKPPTATITIRARQDGNLLVLEVSDDGRGVDTTALRDRLVATGRWSLARAQLATDADVLDALGTGVSIRGDADELAGRGIGLDLVRQTIARLGGEVKVLSSPGRGTTFSMRLPLSTSLAQAMLFKVGGQVYAIPAVHVSETTIVDASATTVTIRQEQLPVLRLENLLGQNPSSGDRRPGVVVSFAGKTMVCSVDKIVGPREIIIKPLGPLLAPLTLYAAATISGSGKVQLILDPAQLVRRVYPDAHEYQDPVSAPMVLAGRALVVDDSRAIREAMTSMLGREGWIVDVAEDGARALQMTRQLRYDLVVTDLEMPELSGFDFIARLRKDERFKTTPIVIITSRANPEHRRRAKDLGVRALVAKPITRRKLLEALAAR